MHCAFAPALARFGVGLELARSRAGFYPAGGGCMEAQVQPCGEPGTVDLTERGVPQQAVVTGTVADMLSRHILQRQSTAAQKALEAAGV